MKRSSFRYVTVIWVGAWIGAFVWASSPKAWAAVPRTPEQESMWLSRQLKPIPDEEWSTIAGAEERREMRDRQGRHALRYL